MAKVGWSAGIDYVSGALSKPSKNGKAVRGTITGTAHVLPTLENAEFIIPEGKYELKMTYSPRFKKMMPLVDGVKGRSGIRIHTGTIPEHSKGCILMTPKGVEIIKELLTQNKKKDEKTFIHISSDGLRGSGHDEL
jgi:hypothetical protein